MILSWLNILQTSLSSTNKSIQPLWILPRLFPKTWRGKLSIFLDYGALILSIVLIAILATISGATGWEEIEIYAESHQVWLETFLTLENGVPKADTYRRVFERINTDKLQECFWVGSKKL